MLQSVAALRIVVDAAAVSRRKLYAICRKVTRM
jgi:hypothetical protein